MPKQLLLLRHAKSSWDDASLKDFDRPLSSRGIKAAPRMGKYIHKNNLLPDLILCSTAVRTRETLDLASQKWKVAVPVEYTDSLYLANAQQILEQIYQQDDDVDTLMVVGHNTGMELLAELLIRNTESPLTEALRSKFPTAALAVYKCKLKSWQDLAYRSAKLVDFVTPRSLSEKESA